MRLLGQFYVVSKFVQCCHWQEIKAKTKKKNTNDKVERTEKAYKRRKKLEFFEKLNGVSYSLRPLH